MVTTCAAKRAAKMSDLWAFVVSIVCGAALAHYYGIGAVFIALAWCIAIAGAIPFSRP